MSKLFAGPWVGEFGHELFAWQGYVRWYAQQNDFDEVIVACPTGHELLYEDFADRIINYNLNCRQASLWRCLDEGKIPEAIEEKYISKASGDIHLNPQDGHVKYLPHKSAYNMEKQIFVPFGRHKPEKSYDMVIHAREKRWVNKRDWRRWEEFMELLPSDMSIAAIGKPDQAQCPPQAHDLRGISLRELADVLASSKMVVGTSSGPMHFAALCKCPIVFWSRKNNIVRYKKDWNPFSVPVEFVLGWQPEPKRVYRATRLMHARINGMPLLKRALMRFSTYKKRAND